MVIHGMMAQVDLRYNGNYTVANYEGIADFSFLLNKGDTLLNGTFEIKNASISKLLRSADDSFEITGDFSNGNPVGDWKFNFNNYKLADNEPIEVANYLYVVKVNGTNHKVTGSFLEGQPHGNWNQLVKEINESEVEQTLFKSQIDFNKGVPQKSFSVESANMTLAGRFLRDGHAHDLWELFSTSDLDATERWLFDDGWLKKIEWNLNDSVYTFNMYSHSIDTFRVINLDSRYLEILKLTHLLNTSESILWQSNMSSLLDENAKYYKTIDDILLDLGSSSFMPEFKVKVYYNPLNSNELNQLNAIKKSGKEANAIANRILNSTQIKLLQLTDEHVLFLTKVTEKINENHLQLINRINDYQDQDILEHVPRQQLLSKLCSDSLSVTKIEVHHEQQNQVVYKDYEGSKVSSFSFDRAGIESVFQFTEYVLSTLQDLESEINSKLTQEQLEQELQSLEEELIMEVTKLDGLLDSISSSANEQIKSVLGVIKSTTKNELSSYSSMDDLANKPEKARSLILCFASMKELAKVVTEQTMKNEEIEKLYTDRVWNPFTSTLMDETIKKRIVDAYFKILLPDLLSNFANLSCENVESKILLFNNLNMRMLDLRFEETDRLERKLKRENNPEAILELLLNNNNNLQKGQ